MTNQNAEHVYKYVSIRRKNKAISGRSIWKWKKKNGVHEPENEFPLEGIGLFFKNWLSTSTKNLQIKEYCFK